MKKFLAFILVLTLALGTLAGCGSKSESATATEATATEETAAEETTTEATATEETVAEEATTEEKSFHLRCGITVSSESVAAKALAVFKEEVEEATDGTVTVEVFYDGTMGNERDVIEGVSMGTIEMFCGSTAPLANFTDAFQIWDLPFAVDINNMQAAYDIMDGEVGQDMLDSLSSIGIKGLAMAHNGFRFMLNRVREVEHPADASNLVIRTMENDIHLAFYKAIGANPTPMASTEAFTALAQGTIDGMDNNLDAFYTQGAFESAKYLTLTGHVFSASIFLMNQEIFDAMSENQQAAVLAAIHDAAVYQRENCYNDMTKLQEIAKNDYGVTVTEVDVDEWKELCAPVYETYQPNINDTYWNAFFG